MQLHGIVGGPGGGPGSKVFRHQSFAYGLGIACLPRVSCTAAQQARRVSIGNHLGKLALDKLMLVDGDTKLFSFTAVIEAGSQTCLSNSHATPCDAVPAKIEGGSDSLQMGKSRFPNSKPRGHAAVVQFQFSDERGP